jgi:hypothetical protein
VTLSPRIRSFVPGGLCVLALAGAGACIALDLLDRAHIHSFADAQPAGPVLAVSFSLLGTLIVSRSPGNRIGWIYLLIGVAMSVQGFGALYYERSLVASGWPGGRWGAWVSNWAVLPVFPTGLALFAFLLYPSGRLPSPRWRWVAQAAVGLGVLLFVTTLLDPAPIGPGSGFRPVANATGVGAFRWLDAASGVLFLLGIALIGATIAGLAVRARRAPTVERQQVKLLAYAAALTIGILVAVSIASFADSSLGSIYWNVPIVFGFGIAVPVACGFAILRHGLYEIDRLISRTLAYALLTGLLVGVFAGLVLLTTRVLPFSSPVGVAASTLVAAGLFSPLRVRLQRLVDRRFNRARYDAEATVAAFATRLRDAVDVDTVLDELTTAVAHSLEPAEVTVWVRTAEAS